MRRIALGALLLLPALARAEAPTIEALCAKAGCAADAIARVRQGKWIELSPPESSERDLGVGFIFLVRHPPAEVAKAFRVGVDFSADPDVLASHRMAPAGTLADFATLRLPVHGADEAKRYTAARPGDELNLSDAEIAAFAKLGGAATQSDVEARLRQQLFARYQAYRMRGLDGIDAYARAKGTKRQPADDLREMIGKVAPVLQQYAPAFKALVSEYPAGRSVSVSESFHWLVYNLDDRPTVVLRHRMTLPMGDAVAFVDREYYVAHGYNTMQVLGALFPTKEGTIVFYSAHTSTDQAAGSGTAMKHGIGRRVMSRQLRKIFERVEEL
jgi:hypothetical protein